MKNAVLNLLNIIIISLKIINVLCLNENSNAKCTTDILNLANTRYEWNYNTNATTLYSISTNNLCWDKDFSQLIVRKCETKSQKWLPEKVNCSKFMHRNKFCPEHLIEIPLHDSNEYICLKISKLKHSYDERFCYGSDTLPTMELYLKWQEKREAVFNYLSIKNINEFWIPVKKVNNNLYNPFIVHLPGKYWSNPFDQVPLTIEDLLSKRQCLSAEFALLNKSNENRSANSTFDRHLMYKLTNCEEKLYSICMFSKHFVTVSGCPQKYYSISYEPNKCYGVEMVIGLFPLDVHPLTIADYYQNRNTLRILLQNEDINHTENFIVGEFNGFGGDSSTYSIEMNVKEQIQIIHKNDQRKSALSWEKLKNRKKVQMILKFDTEDLILTIYNRFYIWRLGKKKDDNIGVKCFTNSNFKIWETVKLKTIWENDHRTKTIFKVIILNGSSGYYWCEAHTIFDFGLVRTDKIVVTNHKRGHTYSVHLNVECTESDICDNVHGNLKKLSKQVKSELERIQRNEHFYLDDLEINDVRIMEIQFVTIKAYIPVLECVVHITTSLKSSNTDDSFENSNEEDASEEDEDGVRYDTRMRMKQRDLLDRLLNSYAQVFDVAQINVKSTKYCFPEDSHIGNGDTIKWTQANIGETVTTTKLCLNANGIPVTRKCEGDFIEGAQWEILNTSMLICNTDNVITKSIYKIYSEKKTKFEINSTLKNIDEILEKNIYNLIPADVYYVGKILQTIFNKLDTPESYNNTIANNNKIDFNDNVNNQWGNENEIDEISAYIVRIYNYLMEINENIMKSSTVLNATNILLDAFEQLIDSIPLRSDENGEKLFVNQFTDTPNEHSDKSNAVPSDGIFGNDNEMESNNEIQTIDYNDIGVSVKIANNLIIFLINPYVANITGICIFNANDDLDADENKDKDMNSHEFIEEYNKGQEQEDLLRGSFQNMFYRFLLANQSIEELLDQQKLEIATFVPDTLLNRLDEISLFPDKINRFANKTKSTKIVIKIYGNDHLFQEQNNNMYKVGAKILSISIPQHNKLLPEMLPLMFRTNQNEDNELTVHNKFSQACSYWNYKSWENDGLTFLARSMSKPEIILCGCTHLTPFAYLVAAEIPDFSDFHYNETHNNQTTNDHKNALNVITLLGCSLSILGVIGIFLTAFTFQSWRQKASSKVLLQLSMAIALQMLLFCFINTEENTQNLIKNKIFVSCIVLGAFLHYSILVQFSWMLIIAYLQFKRYVQVFGNSRPKRFFIKSTIVGWLIPTLPVILVVIFDRYSYIPIGKSICYPTGYTLYFGVILPIIIVILTNLVIFIIVLYNIMRGPDGTIRHTEKKIAISQIRLSILLFFLLGFTWIFGLITTMQRNLIFSYLFCLTATLQGFVIFIYFILMDPFTRRLWCGYLQRKFAIKTVKDNSLTSVKETTQTQ